MSIQMKEKGVELIDDEKELEYRIDIATQTLERNINFISSCDNKTSIVLTAIGVLLTIILTSDGLSTICNTIKSSINERTFCGVLYLFFFISVVSMMGYGIISLVTVLIGRTYNKNSTSEPYSRVFFSGIIKYGDCKNFIKNFCVMSRQEFLNELITEIYINAEIAEIKYRKYNIGLKFTVISFVLFVFLLLVGVYIY